MQFLFLSTSEVLEIHLDQIERYGGTSGIRSPELLESAVAQPEATFEGEFLLGDIFEMAAAYLFHLVQNHPFVDGNKRVGTVAALVFLDRNGVEVNFTDDELVAMILEVAQGRMDRGAIATCLRAHAA